MRKEDIEFGVEYCETAPLAYGREPSTTPYKVRFTGLQPSFILFTSVAGEDGLWQETRREVLPMTQYDRYPRQYAAVREAKDADGKIPPGTEIQYRQDQPVKGALPVERWITVRGEGKWFPGVCAPSAVHRTWAEYQAVREIKAERGHQRKVTNAPRVLRNSVAEALEAARLLDPESSGLQMVIDEANRQCG